jgi:hypothetical protein
MGGILDQARALVKDGRGDALIDDAAFVVPMSAATLVSVYGDPSITDVFPFRLGESGDFGRLKSLGVPVLATMGTIDEAVTVPSEEAARLLGLCGGDSPGVRAVVVEGANHIYWGRERKLAGLVAEFLKP